MVEHSPEEGGVVGSSPTGATKYAALAERLTRLPAKQITRVRFPYAAPYVLLAELAYAGASRAPSLLGSNPRGYTKRPGTRIGISAELRPRNLRVRIPPWPP